MMSCFLLIHHYCLCMVVVKRMSAVLQSIRKPTTNALFIVASLIHVCVCKRERDHCHIWYCYFNCQSISTCVCVVDIVTMTAAVKLMHILSIIHTCFMWYCV